MNCLRDGGEPGTAGALGAAPAADGASRGGGCAARRACWPPQRPASALGRPRRLGRDGHSLLLALLRRPDDRRNRLVLLRLRLGRGDLLVLAAGDRALGSSRARHPVRPLGVGSGLCPLSRLHPRRQQRTAGYGEHPLLPSAPLRQRHSSLLRRLLLLPRPPGNPAAVRRLALHRPSTAAGRLRALATPLRLG